MRTKSPEQADKILEVAVRFFATHRFHEARMEDIAAAAGVGKGTLYRYFKDKEELYLALLERSSQHYAELLSEAANRASGPREKLEALTTAILCYFDENPHVFDLLQHAEALQRPDQRFPWKQARAISLELTRAALVEGQQCGLFRAIDPGVAALMLLGGLRAILRFGEKPRPADLVQRIIDGVLHGVAACSEPNSLAANGHGRRAFIN